MIYKLLALVFTFFIFCSQSCYTITHPTPCPGLVDANLDSDDDSNCLIY